MAKDKKKSAKVNGQKLQDGDKVTLVIQATVTITDDTLYNGEVRRYVTFESKEDPKTFDAQWFEADNLGEGKKGHYLSSTTIVKVES